MIRRYIIQIDGKTCYPFDGDKPNIASTLVRHRYTLLLQGESSDYHYHQRIKLLLKVDCQHIIKILEIQEIKGKQLVICYEYVGESIKISNRISELADVNLTKQKCIEIFQLLISNRIKAKFQIDNIGFDSQGQLKIFIPLDYQIISQEQVQPLSLEIPQQIEKSFELHFSSLYHVINIVDNKFQYSQRLSIQIAKIQQKIKSRNRNSRNHNSPQNSNDSRLQKSKSRSSKESNSSLAGPTSNSVIQSQKTRNKIHKSSFGDYTTTSHRLNQEQTQQVNLKDRVHNALSKTQEAFKIYQKYNRKRSRI